MGLQLEPRLVIALQLEPLLVIALQLEPQLVSAPQLVTALQLEPQLEPRMPGPHTPTQGATKLAGMRPCATAAACESLRTIVRNKNGNLTG